MRGWLAAAAMGILLAVLALAVADGMRTGAGPSAGDRVDHLARELRCPDCQGLSVADSPTRSAQEIRRQIARLVADGATDGEVREHFVARYGDWILLAPSSPAAWIIPFVVVLAGAGALAAWLVAERRRVPAPVGTISDEERRRLRAEAEALDA